MRTAYEKGFNVVTLTDCTATTSPEGQAAATGGTYGMFSAPMTGDEFASRLYACAKAGELEELTRLLDERGFGLVAYASTRDRAWALLQQGELSTIAVPKGELKPRRFTDAD